MHKVTIKQIQGTQLESPLAGQTVQTRGVVTALMRRGFFIQTAGVDWDGESSDAIFVYASDHYARLDAEVEVVGEVVDYIQQESSKPVTQLHMEDIRTVRSTNGKIDPIVISAEFLPPKNSDMAVLLNSLEGMLLSIPRGQTFIAPSNPFGDYVLAMDSPNFDSTAVRTKHAGVIIANSNPLRWFPGFRVTNYNHAPRLNVGARLASDIVGPLNFRVDSYQLAVHSPFEVEPAYVSLIKSSIKPSSGSLTVMTLNCFNLDPHIESEDRVLNPRQDVDDDWGDGRFHTLAQAIVLQANVPDIVALQEIQDNDGAEITEVVAADQTYGLLVKAIEQICGVRYQWVDIDPKLGADGGQPGGNIRNGFLYNPSRVAVDPDDVQIFGAGETCFQDSRKPLIAIFAEKETGKQIACINVHLASKRHQNSIFSPIDPGQDSKLEVRMDQARVIADKLQSLTDSGFEYYLTGDFNDTEHSETLKTLLGGHSRNLVESIPPEERYDYNHRGKLQVLMHGIVPHYTKGAQYEIIHGNELLGVKPGEQSDKPSDHAYVIAKLALS